MNQSPENPRKRVYEAISNSQLLWSMSDKEETEREIRRAVAEVKKQRILEEKRMRIFPIAWPVCESERRLEEYVRDKEGRELLRQKAIAEEAEKKKIRMKEEERKSEQLHIAMGIAVSSLTLDDFILQPEVINAAQPPETPNGNHIVNALYTFTRNFKALVEPPLTKKTIFNDPMKLAAYFTNMTPQSVYRKTRNRRTDRFGVL
uniref:Uncharacterized protein n=1 Tax=Caenorhabditis japonica TaxID=281687 RepID=A0A8R1HUU7_CAEJA